jgi:hypothetical protein
VIHLEVVAEQRQPEPPLPLERAVAGTAVAADVAKQRNEMPLKIRDFLNFGRFDRSLAGARVSAARAGPAASRLMIDVDQRRTLFIPFIRTSPEFPSFSLLARTGESQGEPSVST